MFPAAAPIKDANCALQELRELIHSPDWVAQGGKLPTEREMTIRLGIGRHALRRALEVLETEGLIWRRQGAGTFVGPRPEDFAQSISSAIPLATFDEVMEVRLRLEPQIAQMAAMRANGDDITRMQELNRRCIEAVDPEACELWDGAFHRQIAVAARNHLFLTLFDILNRVRQDASWQNARSAARAGEGDEAAKAVAFHHGQIITAIAERDPLAAATAMRDHMLDIQTRLMRRLTRFDDAAFADSPNLSVLQA
ncbi:FadR/GntR family transcriptional regulator [Paracoccus sp. (in: a-proteobacteria)]|uniref:FadR/GntR family transcriptional regulator n=1 Tax=Paracoccus sp. TaxID=267 RepID=UPI0028A2D04A|nr:FCD domain-containing protein [Paracoccus sp. (in: a-proteobacteria)]